VSVIAVDEVARAETLYGAVMAAAASETVDRMLNTNQDAATAFAARFRMRKLLRSLVMALRRG
jgi:hypothetical protein